MFHSQQFDGQTDGRGDRRLSTVSLSDSHPSGPVTSFCITRWICCHSAKTCRLTGIRCRCERECEQSWPDPQLIDACYPRYHTASCLHHATLIVLVYIYAKWHMNYTCYVSLPDLSTTLSSLYLTDETLKIKELQIGADPVQDTESTDSCKGR